MFGFVFSKRSKVTNMSFSDTPYCLQPSINTLIVSICNRVLDYTQGTGVKDLPVEMASWPA